MKLLIVHRLKAYKTDAACLIKMGVLSLLAYPLFYYPDMDGMYGWMCICMLVYMLYVCMFYVGVPMAGKMGLKDGRPPVKIFWI